MSRPLWFTWMIGALIYSGPTAIARPVNILTSDQLRAWESLLHYRYSQLGRYGSTIDDPRFFLSSNGSTDSLGELNTTLERMRHDLKLRCQYPARAQFLVSVGLLQRKEQDCQDFERWKANSGGSRLSLVFASQYLSNPSSSMGHSFFVLRKDGRLSLLDATLGYAAQMPEDVAFLSYAIGGIGGAFPGYYSTAPFYGKLYEYGHMESRDLWEYELNFKTEEVERLLAHLYEIGRYGRSAYYFFDENCAIRLLQILQAIRPESEIAELPLAYVLPIDTIKEVKKQGWIKNVSFYPSLRTQIEGRIGALSSSEKMSLNGFLKEGQKAEALSTPALDAALLLFDFKKMKHLGQLMGEDPLRYRSALLERSKRGVVKQQLKIQTPQEHPEESHGSHTLGAAIGRLQDQAYLEGLFLPGVHDHLFPDTGFLPFSEFELLRTELRYWFKPVDSIQLHSLQVLALRNLPEHRFFDPLWSWKFNSELRDRSEEDCPRCLEGLVEGGYGKTFGSEKLRLSVLAQTKVSNFRGWQPVVGLSVGPEVLMQASLPSLIKLELGASHYSLVLPFLANKTRTALTFLAHQPFAGKDWELTFLGRWSKTDNANWKFQIQGGLQNHF